MELIFHVAMRKWVGGLGNGETGAATAGGAGLGVMDLEIPPSQLIHKIQPSTTDEFHRGGINGGFDLTAIGNRLGD